MTTITDTKEEKICTKCEISLPFTEFYSQKKKRADGTDYNYYLTECKECTKKRTRKWAIEHPEIVTNSNRKMNLKRKDFLIQYARDNRERNRETLRRWQRTNKGKLKENNEYRKLNKTHKIKAKEWKLCRIYFNYECAYCGISEQEAKEQQGQYLHKEHVLHDGENDLSNCVPSCKSCNSSKRQYTLEEWYNDEHNEHFTYERLEKINSWLNDDYLKYIVKSK